MKELALESTAGTLSPPRHPPDAGAGQDKPPTVAGPIRKALSLSMLNTVIVRAGTFLTGIVLARLLSPANFGVYAVALVVLTALLSLNELGVSLAIVRWQGDPRSIAPTVTTIAVGNSALLYAGCWFAAPTLAASLGAPGGTGIIRVLCLSVLIDGLTSTPAQLLNRDFKQGRRLLADFANLLVTAGVTVGLAAAHYGAWSLAIGQLVGNTVAALVLFHLAQSWPHPGFDRTQAKELLRFGVPLAASSALMIGMLNVQYVVIGGMLGAVALGFYLLAFNLSSWPVTVFSQVVRRVSLAAFSQVQSDRALRQAALIRLAVLLLATVLPVCLLLGLLASPAIDTVYGTKWSAAAAALPFLAILALVRVVSELAYDFLAALGHSRATLWLQGAWFLILAAALPVGAAADGIRGVAIAHGAVAAGIMLPAYGKAFAGSGVSLPALARALIRPVAGSLVLVLAVLATRSLIPSPALQLVVGGIVGLAVYVPVVWPLRAQFRELG